MEDFMIELAIRDCTQVCFSPHAFAGNMNELCHLSDEAEIATKMLIVDRDTDSFLDRIECLPGLNMDDYLEGLIDNYSIILEQIGISE